MLKLAKVWFMIFGIVFLTSLHASDISEASIKQLMSKIDSAVNTLNAQEVANVLSDDVEIILNINIQGQKQVLNPSKQEYIGMLQQGWNMSTNYKYNRTNVVINVKGNKALVFANVQESMIIQGQKISSTSKEEATIEMINGVPLITKVIGYTSM